LPKPHSEFFSSHKTNFLSFSILTLFFIVFIPLIATLIKIDAMSVVMVYGVSASLIIILLLSNKEIINQIAAQAHNIFIAFLFIIVTLDRLLIGLSISIITIFVVIWYHRIYVDKFASHYFNEMHHEKV